MAIIKGKSFYAKILGKPSQAYDPDKTEWSIDVSVDKETREYLTELGLEHKIKTKENHPAEGEFITFKRPGEKQDGDAAKPIRVVDRRKKPWPDEDKIGNGSEVAVSFVVNEGDYRGKPWKKPGVLGIMVLDHIPYEDDELDQFAEPDEDGFDDAPFDN